MSNVHFTPARTVRVTEELWQRAGRVARANGETISDVLRRALDDYAPAPEAEPVEAGK